MRYLELVCKYGDLYAVRGTEKGYAYLTKQELNTQIGSLSVDERNCIMQGDNPVLKNGSLPVFGVGANFVSHFDGHLLNAEYVYNVRYYFNAHANTLIYDEWVQSMLKSVANVEISNMKDLMVRPLNDSKSYHISFLSVGILAIIIAYSILEYDRICILNISECELTEKFMDIISRFKAIYLYHEDFDAIKRKFRCDVFLDGYHI